jgi:hypothetical protein
MAETPSASTLTDLELFLPTNIPMLEEYVRTQVRSRRVLEESEEE